MKKIKLFITELVKETYNDEMIPLANELAFKLLLALFPFLIFLMTIIGFLNMDKEYLLMQISGALPDEIYEMVKVFVNEVVNKRRVSLLSTSLAISVFSASSGFAGVIRGINRAYGQKETRSFIKVRIISIGLVFVFTLSILLLVVLLLFGNSISSALINYFGLPAYTVSIYRYIAVIFSMAFMVFATMIIYKIACCEKTKFSSHLPGAFVTVIMWALATNIFNIYIENYASYSAVYGSIGSVFILMIWLNIISMLLLIGCEINDLCRQ